MTDIGIMESLVLLGALITMEMIFVVGHFWRNGGLFQSIDEKFEEIGFVKTREDIFGVTYECDLIELPYIHVIELVRKKNGYHLIQSYQRGVNSDGFNNSVGITSYEAKLCRQKMKKIGWKCKR